MNDLYKPDSNYLIDEKTEKMVAEMLSNPELFVKKIEELSGKLKEDKQKSEEIKNMAWGKRIFKNTLKMQAESNLRQNQIMEDFSQLLTTVTFLSKGNAALLAVLFDSLCRSEEANGNNQFYEQAKASIQGAIESAKNEEKREKALKKALVKANENESKIAENESKLSGFKEEIKKRINNAIDLVKNHINIKKEETDEKINKEINSTIYYINEQIKILNSRADNDRIANLNMIESLGKSLSNWKMIALISILFNIVNLVLIVIFVM